MCNNLLTPSRDTSRGMVGVCNNPLTPLRGMVGVCNNPLDLEIFSENTGVSARALPNLGLLGG